MTVTSIDHVQLAMPEGREAEATAFYEGLLGLTRVPKPDSLAARSGCWFATGEARVHLGVEAGFRPARKAHPALRVDDLDALSTRLGDADVQVRRDEPLDGCARAFVVDPFGNRIELVQAAASLDRVTLVPIGAVVGGRVEAIDDDWGSVEAQIVLDDRFPDDCTAGLAEFSHIEVVYVFDQVDEGRVTSGARHPRGRRTGRSWASSPNGPRHDPIGWGSPRASCSR